MKLYHGSMVIVDAPRILTRSDGRGADFGAGFYTTSSYRQAVRWVHIRQSSSHPSPPGFVSIFEAPDNLLQTPGLSIKVFTAATRAWLRFVWSNRNNPSFSHPYDIVKGPVANDRVYATLTLWEGGFLSETQTVQRLKTFRLVDQFLFHTEAALRQLHFLQARQVAP